jgi:hypothetical protein
MMAELIMRHYIVKDHDCEPCRETAETLRNLGTQMASRLAPLGLELKLQEAEMAEASEENLRRANQVTFSCDEAEMTEIALEDILGLQVTHEPAEGEACDNCRTLIFEGRRFQKLPPGLVADGLVRAAFSILEGGDGTSCGGCGGG